jgi:hypothetical protein
MNKAKKKSTDKSDYLMLVRKAVFTSPHRPTTSSKSFRPDDNSIIHLLTAFDERSGVRSSSDTSIQPSDRTAKRIDSGSIFIGKLRRLENQQKLTNPAQKLDKRKLLYHSLVCIIHSINCYACVTPRHRPVHCVGHC